jgi:hypothetical protein
MRRTLASKLLVQLTRTHAGMPGPHLHLSPPTPGAPRHGAGRAGARRQGSARGAEGELRGGHPDHRAAGAGGEVGGKARGRAFGTHADFCQPLLRLPWPRGFEAMNATPAPAHGRIRNPNTTPQGCVSRVQLPMAGRRNKGEPAQVGPLVTLPAPERAAPWFDGRQQIRSAPCPPTHPGLKNRPQPRAKTGSWTSATRRPTRRAAAPTLTRPSRGWGTGARVIGGRGPHPAAASRRGTLFGRSGAAPHLA